MAHSKESQYHVLWEQEKKFAQEVVCVMRANSERPWWYCFVPFKSLFEYLALKRNVRHFSTRHLGLKKIALSAAYSAVQHQDQERGAREVQRGLQKFWMQQGGIEHQHLYKLLASWLDLLFRHYYLLLSTGEEDYPLMLRKVYPSPEEYTRFHEQLIRIERKVDQAVMDIAGIVNNLSYIQSKQKAFQQVRNQELNKLDS